MALFGKEKEKNRTITIPEELAERIDKRIKGTAFPSASAYVAYVLTEVLGEANTGEDFNAEDEELVKKRLRSLGYLD